MTLLKVRPRVEPGVELELRVGRSPVSTYRHRVAVIRLRGVIVLLERFPALAGVDLHVDAGEIILVRGPNGAGKSTLLGCCAGLRRPHSGTATVLGCDITSDRTPGRAELRRRVGLLGHDTALYDDLTVTENLELGARAARVPRREAPGALDRLALPSRLRTVPVGRLSAGQRRRTALAAIALRRPELWLLDEPHGGLDRPSRRIVDELIVEAATSGATVVVASHESGHVAGLATRTVTMTAGMVTDDAA